MFGFIYFLFYQLFHEKETVFFLNFAKNSTKSQQILIHC